jgi:hypothetical protein
MVLLALAAVGAIAVSLLPRSPRQQQAGAAV